MSRIAIHTPNHQREPELPECPDWLGDQGKAKWREVLDLLSAEPGRLQPIDGDFLAMYCDAFDELHASMQLIKELGKGIDIDGPNGSKYPHPVVARKNKAKETIRKFGRELGLNPTARKSKKAALKIVQPAKQKPS